MPYSPHNTFAAIQDVEKRLTAHGVTWAIDVLSYDNDRDSLEIQYAEESIEWANTLIDAALAKHGFSCQQRPDNEWCRQRAVDISAYRLLSLGGRDVPQVIREDYERALQMIQRAEDGDLTIPCLSYPSATLNTGRRSYNMPFAVNPCGGPRPCRTRR